jgi:hypothetical protein
VHAAHTVSAEAVQSAVRYVPAAHTLHVRADVAPPVQYEPAGQASHTALSNAVQVEVR